MTVTDAHNSTPSTTQSTLLALKPRSLSPQLWEAWRDAVVDLAAEAYPQGGTSAKRAVTMLAHLINVTGGFGPAGTPLEDLLTDVNIEVAVAAKRHVSVQQQLRIRNVLAHLRAVATGTAAPVAFVTDAPTGRQEPSVDLTLLTGALRAVAGDADHACQGPAKLLLANLSPVRPEPWPSPLAGSTKALRREIRQAIVTDAETTTTVWRLLKSAAIWESFSSHVPAATVLTQAGFPDTGLAEVRLERLLGLGPVSDVAPVARAVRGTGRLLWQHGWTIKETSEQMPARKPLPERTKRPSRAEVLRQQKATLAAAQPGGQLLSEELEAQMAAWTPATLTDAEWLAVQGVVRETARRSQQRTADTLGKFLNFAAQFYAWAHRNAYDLSVDATFTEELIAEFIRIGPTPWNERSRSTAESKLRAAARKVHRATAPRFHTAIAHQDARPPYSPTEVARILLWVSVEPNPQVRRQLQVCVALGLGAGLSSGDIRVLKVGDIEDHGADGILVHVPGDQPRSVWMRVEHEALLRAGLRGLTNGCSVLGRGHIGKSAFSNMYDRTQSAGDGPRVVQGRLRNTWIATLMTEPIPLWTLLNAAGLKGARTLADLFPYVVPTEQERCSTALRGQA